MRHKLIGDIGLPLAVALAVFSAGYPVASNMKLRKCNGPCMEQKIHNGDFIFYESFPMLNRRLNKGDIVRSILPNNKEERIVKRIAAMPGDTICNLLQERVLGDSEYWLLGDNQSNSYDSRFFGPANEINARGLFVYCPHERNFLDRFKSAH
ncbi:S26 family signal peptidase [Candidatus Pacearchaeota archaeon]|nr:S26 family signal peptidase [Candidatus Pacearchaeota archaeon]